MSRSAPRRSSIDWEDYVPQKGDLLDSFEQGITYECVRADTWIDPKSGEKIKYGILIAYPDALEGAPLAQTFLEGTQEIWLGTLAELNRGEGIQRIRRTRYGVDAEQRTYEWDVEEARYMCDPVTKS